MTVIDGRWPFAGRDAEEAKISAVLGGDPHRGVVLVGPAGVGKTAIAQRVVNGLADQFEHVYLRGSAAHSAVPYGALNVLVAELDEETAKSPLLILSAMQRMFGRSTSRRETVIHLDGVEDIDELSTTVIAHLARIRAVRLLITCESLLRVPGEFFDLWKDGVLERFDLEPLGRDASYELLTGALGGPISRFAVDRLWSASGGNPRYLQLATKADVASGHLFCRDGIWVTRDGPRPEFGRSASDWSALNLAQLPADDRAVVEVLAVSGPIPVALLVQVLPSSSIDALQESGMVELLTDPLPSVKLPNEVMADVVRAQLLSLRGRSALESLSALRGDPLMPGKSAVTLALWLLGQSVELTTKELVAMAELANDFRIPGAPQTFLAALPPDQFDGSAVIQQTRNLWIEGYLDEALVKIEELLGSTAPSQMSLSQWGESHLMAAKLYARTDSREKDAWTLLDDVAARVVREPSTDVTAELQAKVDLLRMELHVFAGDLNRVVDEAPRILAAAADESWSTIRIRGVLGVALSTIGAQSQALRAVRSLRTRSHALSAMTSFDQDEIAVPLFDVLLLAGHWEESLDYAGGAHERKGRTAVRSTGSPLEFAEGVLLSFLGRSQAALEKLLPAISQFRVRDRHGVLPLAEAAAAYAQGLENAPHAAEDHLRAVDLEGGRHSWLLREAVNYFSLMTEALLGTTDGIATEFHGRGLVLTDRGFNGLGLYFLSQAVQLGRYEAADPLLTAAKASDGPFARLCEGFANALLSKDPGRLKDVAKTALDAGHYILAGDIASLSIENLVESDDPMIRVHAEQILRRTSTPARRHVRRKLLSERERAIARLVAQGVANKEIAQQEHISPRTVEGHVHQIMAKLGLSSRRQLALIFGQQQ